MNKILLIIITTLLIHVSASANVKLDGSSTLLPIIKDIKKIYKKQKLIIKGGGSEVGLASLRDGNCDIAMVSRSLTDKEKALGLVEHTIGYDGLAMIVHASNKLNNLNSKDIVDIYTGKINNWSAYFDSDKKIIVIGKEDTRATLKVFANFFKIKHMRKDTELVGSNMEDIIFVSIQPMSIGYVSIGTAQNTINKGASIKLLSLDGIAPNKMNISTKKYKMVRSLNLITYKKMSKEVKEFISFVKSKKGQTIVKKRDFVGI